jgi:hemolysin III
VVYPPFVALTAAHAGWFLAAIWAVAATGAALILLSRGRMRLVSLTLYLGLGWAGAVWGGPLVFGLTPPGLTLLATGGILYTAGVAFLLWDRLPFHNTIWHVFVLAATVVCYAAIMVELWVRIGV